MCVTTHHGTREMNHYSVLGGGLLQTTHIVYTLSISSVCRQCIIRYIREFSAYSDVRFRKSGKEASHINGFQVSEIENSRIIIVNSRIYTA